MTDPVELSGASGMGSWPGEAPDVVAREVMQSVGEGGVPYLAELPARGPGADMIGRTAALLVDLPVDLQPSGWRFVDRPGRDQRRADGFLRSDLDALAEAANGYTGPLKIQVCGPWTLMSGIALQRGERTVSDPGARRDVVESLAEGVARHVEAVQRQVPGARVVLQLDEPSLPSVLEGRLPTRSGVGRIRAVESSEMSTGLRAVLEASGAASTVIHCCARNVPFTTLREAQPGALAVDLGLLGPPGWESVAVGVEDGIRLWAGVVPTRQPDDGDPPVQRLAAAVTDPWRRVGLPVAALADVVVTPTCGLAGACPAWARTATRLADRTAQALKETAQT